MKINRGLIIFLFVLVSLPLFAQETGEPEAETEVEEAEEVNPLTSSERQRINMEIKTSTLSELALWCRTLELSESGTREELSARIRGHFKLTDISIPQNQKVITIESAQSSEYFSIEVISEDYARLKGDVRISLKDGDRVHKISANEILFNRTRNILTASGNVMYEKVDGASIETFRGENITVNIDNWSSIFLDGSSEKKLESDGSSYLFSGKVISRSDEDATILSNATISSASSDEAYWSISASKIWLLPGSDFAILNAVLKVGEIPVLYFPFFYYPADELVFHPVIGYRSREGAFVQTTTYIIGQPKADTSTQSSLSMIMGNTSDKEKELQGLFLRTTGKKIVNKEEVSLKALIDYYVNLGTYIGVDFTSPKKGILNPVQLQLGIGFTRTISKIGENYTPYVSNDGYYDGSYNWNQSNLFSTLVPFRYRMKLDSSISGTYGRLSWSFPFYSDPYTDMDFMNRAESMDWMNMVQQGAAIDEQSSESKIGDYSWQMSGNINPSFRGLAPVISRISISNISTTMLFRELTDTEISKSDPFSPGRHFYAPDKFTIYTLSASISGTPVSVGKTPPKKETKEKQEQNDPFKGYGVPISPWQEEESEQAGTKTKSTDVLTPPVLNSNFSVPGAGNNVFSVDYTLSPTSSTELQFMTGNWKTYKDVDWDEHQSILTNVAGSGVLNFRLDHSKGLYNNTVSFSSKANWQDYSYLNEDFYRNPNTGLVDEQRIEADRKKQYRQTNYNTSYTYNTTLRPLYKNSIFGQSNLQYTFGGTLVKSKDYSDGDGPELTPEWGSWVKEERSKNIYGLNNHRFSTNIDANVMEKRQNLTLTADLPPLDGLISASAGFRVWISETTVNTRMEKPAGADDWIFHPIYFTETLRFGKSNSFIFNMTVKPEENNDIDTIKSTLTLWHFRAVFDATKTTGYSFDKDIGWLPETGDPVLLPKSLTLSYNRPSSNIEIIKNRINLTFYVNTSLQFDLQRYTNSNFSYGMGFTANITGFLELSLTVTSINSVIWRYFKNVPGMEDMTDMYPEGPQNDFFTDLIDSFNFFDETKRRRTGFKMQRLDLSAKHFLGDWTAEFRVGMRPDQNTVTNKYEFISDISFLVQWNPIKEIKTDLSFNGKANRWEKNKVK